MAREKGSVMMIGVAVIYSVTSSLGKMAIEHSSPLFFGVTYFVVMTIVLAPIALFMGRGDLRKFAGEKQYKALLLPGTFLFNHDSLSHDGYQSDQSGIYDITEENEHNNGGNLWIFFVQGKKYKREARRSCYNVHRICNDCNCFMNCISYLRKS